MTLCPSNFSQAARARAEAKTRHTMPVEFATETLRHQNPSSALWTLERTSQRQSQVAKASTHRQHCLQRLDHLISVHAARPTLATMTAFLGKASHERWKAWRSTQSAAAGIQFIDDSQPQPHDFVSSSTDPFDSLTVSETRAKRRRWRKSHHETTTRRNHWRMNPAHSMACDTSQA